MKWTFPRLSLADGRRSSGGLASLPAQGKILVNIFSPFLWWVGILILLLSLAILAILVIFLLILSHTSSDVWYLHLTLVIVGPALQGGEGEPDFQDDVQRRSCCIEDDHVASRRLSCCLEDDNVASRKKTKPSPREHIGLCLTSIRAVGPLYNNRSQVSQCPTWC